MSWPLVLEDSLWRWPRPLLIDKSRKDLIMQRLANLNGEGQWPGWLPSETRYRKRLWNGLALAGLLALPLAGEAAVGITVPAGGSMTTNGGAVNTACLDVNLQGQFLLGTGQINDGGTMGIGATGVMNAGSGLIEVGGDWNNAGTFVPGTSTVLFQDGCSTAPATFSGATTFYNLTLTSSIGRQFIFPATGPTIVTGTLTIQGVPGQPVRLISNAASGSVIELAPGAQLIVINAQGYRVDENGNVIVGGAAPIPALNGQSLALLALLLAGIGYFLRRSPLSRGSDPSPQIS